MKYCFQSKAFTITEKELQLAAHSMLWAIKNIRELAGLPLDKYERKPGLLESADFAQKGVLDAAKELGIDLGAEWGEQLDVREV